MAIDDSFKIINSLSSNLSSLSKTFNQLASGSRINSAKDDSAGLAIVSALDATVAISDQASSNADDGASITSLASDALGQISDITARQAELSTEAANGTLSDSQRQSLDQEYQSLDQSKSQILSTTSYNGTNVFSGTTLQVGNDSSSSSQLAVPSVDTSGISSSQSIATQAGAKSALGAVSTEISNLGQDQGVIGATQSRIDLAQDSSDTSALQSEAAASQIRDSNIADDVANKTGAQIRSQFDVALLAQASKLNGNNVAKLIG